MPEKIHVAARQVCAAWNTEITFSYPSFQIVIFSLWIPHELVHIHFMELCED